MSAPLVLVACSAAKLKEAAPARELYQGDLFKKSRAYAEALGANWFVLSAHHGLVDPDTVINPYDRTLLTMNRIELACWGTRIGNSLHKLKPQGRQIVMLAGRAYCDPILAATPCQRYLGQFVRPLAGLGIGQQKAWLLKELDCLDFAGCRCALRDQILGGFR